MSAFTSIGRVGAALAGRAADRVPFFLPVTVVGARLSGRTIRDYLSRPDEVVRAQLAWRARLGHDIVTGFHSAAAEVEAFGGEIVYFDDGPPNAGEPPIRDPEAIARLEPPRPEDSPALRCALEATRGLHAAVDGDAAVLGIAMGPFSLPAMQLGLGPWLDLVHDRPELAARLVAVNASFCAAWSNAQLAAGATAVALAEPLASPLLVERSRWQALGAPGLRAALRAIRGAVFIGFGSAPAARAAPDILALGPAALVGGYGDDLAGLKALCRGRATLFGGVDSIPLASAAPGVAERAVRQALRAAAGGGGFILTEHHGEVPWTTSEETLAAVADAAHRWGTYGPGGAIRA